MPNESDFAPMTPVMKKYLRAWVESPKLFGHRSDEHCFYLFVKSVIQNSKQPRGVPWLRWHLEQEGNIASEWIDKAVSWFEICCDYDESMRYYNRTGDPRQFQL